MNSVKKEQDLQPGLIESDRLYEHFSSEASIFLECW